MDSNLINDLLFHRDLDSTSLNGFLPHLVFLPVQLTESTKQTFLSILQCSDNPQMQTIVESEDDHQITYQLVQTSLTQNMKQPIAGRYTLLNNLSSQKGEVEKYIQRKKKLKSFFHEYSSLVVMVDPENFGSLEDSKVQECDAYNLAISFDQNFEKTLLYIENSLPKLQRKFNDHQIISWAKGLRFTNLLLDKKEIFQSLTNLVLYSLKFRINCIYQKASSAYYKFLTKQEEYQQLKILSKNENERQCLFYRQLISANQQLQSSLDGQLSQSLTSAVFSEEQLNQALKGELITQLYGHFEEIKQDYIRILNDLTYSDIKSSLKVYDSLPLEGFLTISQFKSVFYKVISLLDSRCIEIIPAIQQIFLLRIQNIFRLKLKMFQISQIILEQIEQILKGYGDECFKLIQTVFFAYLSEYTFNDEDYQVNKNLKYHNEEERVIWEIKRIGAKYFRIVIIQVQDILTRLLLAQYVRKIQSSLYLDLLNVINSMESMNYEIDQNYSIQLDDYYTQNKKIQTNEICQFYISQHQLRIQDEFNNQDLKENVNLSKGNQRIRFRDRIKQFLFRSKFKQQSKQQDQTLEKQQSRKIDFNFYQRQLAQQQRLKVYRSRSPDFAQNQTNQIEKGYLASEYLLTQSYQGLEQEVPLTVTEWLQISRSDILFQEVPFLKLKLSLARGVPSGMRSSIWQQLTRIELQKCREVKKSGGYQALKEQYLKLRGQDTINLAQITLDVHRSVQRFPISEKENYKGMLENVLVAYSVWDQEVGYTQGMNFITLALLNVYSGTLRNKEFLLQDNSKISNDEIEKNSFLTLILIMKPREWDKVLGPLTPRLVELLNKFQDMFTTSFPALFKQMEELNFNPQILVTHHIISILTSQSQFLFQVRLLDLFLLVGEEVFVCFLQYIKVVMDTLRSLFLISQHEIIQIRDPNQYFEFVRNQMCDFVFCKCQDELDRLFN